MSETKLTAMERQALSAWEDRPGPDDFGYIGFDTVAQISGLARVRVRRVVRALARKGMVTFSSGLVTEDGGFAGSGYAITNEGRAALSAARGEEGQS